MKLKSRSLLTGLLILAYPCAPIQAADLSLRISGAPRYCLLRDVNRGTDGYLDFWGDLLRSDGGLVIENKEPMHFTMSYALDLIVAVDSVYSVIIGAAGFRAGSRSEVLISFTDGRPETSAFVETTIEAIPIKLSLLRSFRLSPSLKAFAEGGFEVYNARFQSTSWPAGPGDSHLQKAHSTGIGALYGMGLEIKALKNLALFLEAQGRYAKIGRFRGTRLSAGSTLPHEVAGTLFFEETRILIPLGTERTYPMLMIEENMPGGDGIRKARVDLSGLSLSAGLRIDF